MKLDPRLQAIAEYVEKGERVADIGTDHGYIPIYLVEKGMSPKIFATDVNPGPLDNARRMLEAREMGKSIELKLGYGLEPIIGERVDKVIIAGMGGLLIRDILLEGEKIISEAKARLVLQPMVAQPELRKWLKENRYRIISERIAKENDKFYEIMLVERGKEFCDNLVYDEIGIKTLEEKDPLLVDFVNHKIAKYEKILENIRRNATESELMDKKTFEIIDRIDRLKEVLKVI